MSGGRAVRLTLGGSIDASARDSANAIKPPDGPTESGDRHDRRDRRAFYEQPISDEKIAANRKRLLAQSKNIVGVSTDVNDFLRRYNEDALDHVENLEQ